VWVLSLFLYLPNRQTKNRRRATTSTNRARGSSSRGCPVSVFWTGNLLRGVPEVDECDSPRSVTRRKRHVAHNLDRFGPRGA
jgi:hypothetical protein